jgi:hypothetical protein
MIFHPDNAEIYANLARGAKTLVDLDPRRAEALAICKETAFTCVDISKVLYENMIAEGRNPYFSDDRHFTSFGMQLVARDFAARVRASNSSPPTSKLINIQSKGAP